MLRDLVNRFAANGFLRSALVLMTGSSLAQALNLLILPLLTHVFVPQDFKVLAVFSALAIVTSLASCLGFDFALPFSKDDDDAVNLMSCAVVSVLGVSLVVAVLTLAFWLGFLNPHGGMAGGYTSFIWLLPLSTLMIGWTNAFEYWSTRRQRFRLISQARIGQVVIGGGLQLALGLMGAGSKGLLFGYILMNGMGLVVLAWGFWTLDRQWLVKVSLANMRRVAAGYSAFPRFTATEALANSGSVYLPVLIISAALVGPEAGFISLAVRLVQAPLYLISRSVSQVYLSRALASLESQRLQADTARVLRILTGVMSGPLLASAILAPIIVTLVLGPVWQTVGVYITWIMPWIFLQFLSTSVLTTMYALGKNRQIMWLTLFGLVFRTGVVALTAVFDKPLLVITYAVSGAVYYGLTLIVFMTANHVRLTDIVPRNPWPVAGLGLCGVAAFAVKFGLT